LDYCDGGGNRDIVDRDCCDSLCLETNQPIPSSVASSSARCVLRFSLPTSFSPLKADPGYVKIKHAFHTPRCSCPSKRRMANNCAAVRRSPTSSIRHERESLATGARHLSLTEHRHFAPTATPRAGAAISLLVSVNYVTFGTFTIWRGRGAGRLGPGQPGTCIRSSPRWWCTRVITAGPLSVPELRLASTSSAALIFPSISVRWVSTYVWESRDLPCRCST